jgi:Synergist-CTERM protein sorting domain-containing protein
VEASDVVTLSKGEYMFADAAGKNPSPVATATSPYLVMNLGDNAAYDMDPATGTVAVEPIFATAKAVSSGGSGGCNAGFMAPIALLVLGAFYAFSRKSRA